MVSPEDLLERSGRGDVDAFRALYRVCAPQLFAVVRAMVFNAAMSEEVLQEAFVKIWRSAASYDRRRGGAMAWMATVTRRLAIDHLRRPALATRPIEDDDVPIDPADSPGHDPVDTGLLDDCLSQLRDEHRQAVVLAYIHGYTYEQLAFRLDRPIGTVKSWVHRAITDLRTCMG